MKVTLLTLACAGFIGSAMAQVPKGKERKLYVGTNSTEALMEFEATVEIETTRSPTLKTMQKAVEAQVEHIIGPMSMTEVTAVPKGDHKLTDIKVVAKSAGKVTVGYKYSGTIVLENGPKTTYGIYLPVNPDKIYSASMVGSNNPCTDEHYQSEGDFWYFWSPERYGCKLEEGKDYFLVKAKIKRYTNSKLTYPEYHNLVAKDGYVHIHVLFGMDEPHLKRDPLKSSDINAANYRQFRNYLIKNGYTAIRWSDQQVRAIAKTLNGDLPYVETLHKGNIAYRFFYGPSGIDEDSLGFHWFYKDALENSSVMIYEGHSGLGGHLDLDSIEESLGEPIKFSKNYQIYFFDSCTSYKYYNSGYFDRKKTASDPNGTKKLDIFTNGLATEFAAMPKATSSVAMAFEKALNMAKGQQFVSFQTLAKQIDSDNLFGVNGDEDNEAPKKL